MKKKPKFSLEVFVKLLIFLLIILNIIFSAWYVLHGDLYFHTDIARDFLLLKELEDKKIVFLGARSGAKGFFHGPIWTYLNFPIYYLSNGNPVFSGYFWVFLAVMILWSTFFLAKKVFGKKTGYLAMLFLSFRLIGVVRDFTHPHLGMLVMPWMVYSLVCYQSNFRVIYLLVHIFLSGLLIQLEIAVGLPITFLIFLYLFFLQLRHKKFIHFLAYLILLLPLSTYIIFDLRHNFFLTKNFYQYIKGNPSEAYVGFKNILKNRFEYLPGFVFDLFSGSFQWNVALVFLFFLFLLLLIRREKGRKATFYKLFFYLFFGYFLLSLKSRYYLLIQHFFAFVPIVLIAIAAVFTSKYWRYFLLVLVLIVFNNEVQAVKFISSFREFTGINESSWKFYAELSQKLFQAGEEKEFGYFIYTPDKLSYSPKYAVIYGQKRNSGKKAYYFEKKPVTYVIIAPPPKEDPYMVGDWWVKNTLKIDKKPEKIINFPNGYRIERYLLDAEERKVPFDPSADTGIHFR